MPNTQKRHTSFPSLSAGLLLMCCVALLAPAARAEKHKTLRNTYSDSYVGVGMRAGIGGLAATGTIDAKAQQGFAYGFDVCYMGELGRHYGFVIGLSFDRLSCSLDAGTITSEYEGALPNTFGPMGLPVDARAHYIGTTSPIKETYEASFVELPVLFSYIPGDWFLNMGVKFAIPVSLKATYDCGATEVILDKVVTTGTDLLNNLEWPMGAKNASEGEYTLYGSGGRMPSVSVMASVEFGYRLQFYNNSSLQFSVYGDCGIGTMGLNNAKSDLLLSFNESDSEVVYRGLLNDGQMTGLRYFKYGFRVQYNFGLGSSPRAGNPIRIL